MLHAPTQDQSLPRIVSLRELAAITGLHKVTLWRLRKSGNLPVPIQISPGRVGWRADVIREWLAAAERQKDVAQTKRETRAAARKRLKAAGEGGTQEEEARR